MEIIVLYLIILNTMGFMTMHIDKRKAIKHEFRIPEKRIFTICILGGSLGVLTGMYTFRHKTKHVKFIIGIPISILINIVTIYYIISHVLLNI